MKIKRRSSITYDTGIDLQKNCNGLTDSRQQQLNMWRNTYYHDIWQISVGHFAAEKEFYKSIQNLQSYSHG